MKKYSAFVSGFFFLVSTVWGNPITVDGYITKLRVIEGVNSEHFITEYGAVIKNFDTLNPDFYAFEIVTTAGADGFEKYCIIIERDEITTLKSALTGMDALQSLDSYDIIYRQRYRYMLAENLPSVRADIENEMAKLKKNALDRTDGEYDWMFVDYTVFDYRTFGSITYIAIGFSDAYAARGGILYTVNSDGIITGKIMLAEDMFLTAVDFARVLSVDRMLLIRVIDPFSPTEISVISIP